MYIKKSALLNEVQNCAIRSSVEYR